MPVEEKLLNANYVKVMFVNFAVSFAFYLLAPLLPLYLSETFNASKDIIGLVLSGYTITALICRPFSGYIVDSFPRKMVLEICLLVYFLFFLGYLIAGSLLVFAIFRTLHGGPFGASTVVNSTMAIDVSYPSRRKEAIGYYGLSNNIATALAPTIGIFLYNYCNNFEVLFWVAFIFAGVGLFVGYTIKLFEKQTVNNRSKLSLDRFFLLRAWTIGVNIAFFGFCFGVISNYLAIYGQEMLGITSGTGVYFMLLSGGLILSRFQGAKSLKEGKLTQNAAVGIIVSTVGFSIFVGLPNLVGYYLSALLIGLGNGHMWPAFQNMIIGIAHHNERGTANSTLLTSWDLGVGVGILLGGVIGEYFGYKWAFISVVIVHLIGLIMYFAKTQKSYLDRKSTMQDEL